jgi:lipopolysaccharide transport system permease protein
MPRLTLITPTSQAGDYLATAWAFRELLWFFARRDFMVRYRQTVVGIGWVVIRPLLAMGVFTLLFGTVAKLPSHGLPYALIVLVGMLPWQFLAAVLSEGVMSVAGNSSLVTKTYFPRILMPLSSGLLNAADLGVNMVFLAAVMAWYQVLPPWQVVLMPIPLLWMMAVALGSALWLAALMVFYRDVRAVVPVVLQFGMLVTPVAWCVSALPPELKWWVWLNPLAGPVELLRWCVLPGMVMPGPKALLLSGVVSVAIVWSGYAFFRRSEARFADVV